LKTILKRILLPLKNAVNIGLTSRKIAIAIALGTVLGLFPVLGITSVLCAVAAYAFGLNMPLMQAINWLITPGQILSMLPLVRLGEFATGSERLIDVQAIKTIMTKSTPDFLRAFGGELFHSLGFAVLGWLVVAPFVGVVVYFSALSLVGASVRTPGQPHGAGATKEIAP